MYIWTASDSKKKNSPAKILNWVLTFLIMHRENLHGEVIFELASSNCHIRSSSFLFGTADMPFEPYSMCKRSLLSHFSEQAAFISQFPSIHQSYTYYNSLGIKGFWCNLLGCCIRKIPVQLSMLDLPYLEFLTKWG